MITLNNYIKNHAIKEIDYFKKKINKKIVPVFIFNNVSLNTLLAIFAYMNRKKMSL